MENVRTTATHFLSVEEESQPVRRKGGDETESMHVKRRREADPLEHRTHLAATQVLVQEDVLIRAMRSIRDSDYLIEQTKRTKAQMLSVYRTPTHNESSIPMRQDLLETRPVHEVGAFAREYMPVLLARGGYPIAGGAYVFMPGFQSTPQNPFNS